MNDDQQQAENLTIGVLTAIFIGGLVMGIAALLCGCSGPKPQGESKQIPQENLIGFPPLPPGANEKSEVRMQNAEIAQQPVGLTASVTPPVAFTLLVTLNPAAPRSAWPALTNGTGSVYVLGSMLPTNQPMFYQMLAWNLPTDPMVAGVNIYFGTNSGNYLGHVAVHRGKHGFATNVTLNLSSGGTEYYEATCYNTAGQEGPYSAEISAQVQAKAQSSQSWAFAAKADVPTILTIK